MATGVVVSCALASFEARAASGDGAYGRLDGDWTFVGGVDGGAVLSPGQAFGGVDLRARYLDSVGLAVAYEESLSSRHVVGGSLRAFTPTLELRPLFLPRFLKAYEGGSAFGDLVLDSLGLEIGARFADRDGLSGTRPGLMLGTAVELPLMAQASGLWLRLGASVRWSAEALEAHPDPAGTTVALSVGLAFHQVVTTHTVDVGDRPIF